MDKTNKDRDIINCGELRHNYQQLAIEILRRTIKEYKGGDMFAKQFLFDKTYEKELIFWSAIAGISIQTIRDSAQSIKKIPSSTVGMKYHQIQPLKHKRISRSNKGHPN